MPPQRRHRDRREAKYGPLMIDFRGARGEGARNRQPLQRQQLPQPPRPQEQRQSGCCCSCRDELAKLRGRHRCLPNYYNHRHRHFCRRHRCCRRRRIRYRRHLRHHQRRLRHHRHRRRKTLVKPALHLRLRVLFCAREEEKKRE